MAEVARVVTVTSGYTGAPGYTTHHFFGDPVTTSTANDAVDAVAAFWEAIHTNFPNGWNASVQPDVHILDEFTGDLVRVESTSPTAVTPSTYNVPYAAGVGAVATWNTGAVHGSKQLRGRTFMSPITAVSYETNGTIDATPLASLRAAVTTLAAVANFGVYGRPRAGASPLTGEWAGCTGGTVRDHVAWLSSRRD